jgi:hypothetical protein
MSDAQPARAMPFETTTESAPSYRVGVRRVHGAVPVRRVLLDQGVWEEEWSDGSIRIVTDLTSELWRSMRAEHKDT